MLSQSAEVAAAAQTPAPSTRPSLTLRLALLYAVSAFSLLAVALGFLYTGVIESLEQDDARFLSDRVHWLRSALRDHAGERQYLVHEVQAEVGRFDAERQHVFYSRILDESGATLLETPGMAALAPANVFPVPAANEVTSQAMQRWSSNDGRAYWLTAAWAESGERPPRRQLIQVALDDTVEERLLARYELNSILLLAAGSLLFAGIGVLVARHGLQPLAKITRSAERVAASRLEERIGGEPWPEELVALARAFDLMLARLQDSFGRLSRFSTEVAHELRNPIQNLMGEIDLCLAQPREPAQYRRVLESSLEECAKLSRLINRLLFLARADNPTTGIERVRLDVRRELEAVREFHEALAAEQGVRVSCRGEASIDADPLLVRHAVTNLLSNALHHTPRGGAIVLAAAQEAGRVRVEVGDSGCGIAPERLAHVFDRHCQAMARDGAGLGLAIVKSIMDLHSGKVSVESAPGQGTTVVLEFPAPAAAHN